MQKHFVRTIFLGCTQNLHLATRLYPINKKISGYYPIHQNFLSGALNDVNVFFVKLLKQSLCTEQ